VQYATPVDAPDTFAVVEVFLVNTGRATRTFSAVSLNGRALGVPPSGPLADTGIALDADRLIRLKSTPVIDPDVSWWQFYPSPEVPPGQTAVLMVCFRRQQFPIQLTVRDAAGVTTDVSVPRRRLDPEPRLSAITFERDLSRVYVQCASRGIRPATVWFNGWPVVSTVRLEPAIASAPVLLSCRPPFAIARGMPLDVRVRFEDGRERRALIRAFGGISLEAPGDLGPGVRSSRDLLLDANPAVTRLSVDVVCSDLTARHPGLSAWNAISDRQRIWRKHPDVLSGLVFCTGFTADSWNIYGPLADAIYVKPNRHGWGSKPERFLDEELDVLVRARTAAAPRPFLYIPERPPSHGRYITPEELRVACWSAIAAGAKGLRYHYGHNERGFADTPALLPAAIDIDRRVREWEDRLSPLVPVSDAVQGRENTGYVRVLAAWAGERGVLFCVRNQDQGAFPTGAVTPRRNVNVTLDIPPWCRPTGITDLESGTKLADGGPGPVNITLPELATCRLLWADAR
jgi:hypothetical protein